MIVFINENNLRNVGRDFFIAHRTIGANNHQIAEVRATCSSAIQRDLATTSYALNRISREALTVIDVVQLNSFANLDVGSIQ